MAIIAIYLLAAMKLIASAKTKGLLLRPHAQAPSCSLQ